MRGVGRERWRCLWSGVIFFCKQAAIVISLKAKTSLCYTHTHAYTPCWLRQLVQWANFTKLSSKGIVGHYFKLHCQEKQLHHWVFRLMLEWVQIYDELCWPLAKERFYVLLNLFALFYCSVPHFLKKIQGRLFQTVVHPTLHMHKNRTTF